MDAPGPTLQRLEESAFMSRPSRILVAGGRRGGKTFLCERLSELLSADGSCTIVVTRGAGDEWSGADVFSPTEAASSPRWPGNGAAVLDDWGGGDGWATDPLVVRALSGSPRLLLVTLPSLCEVPRWMLARFDAVFAFRDFVQANIDAAYERVFGRILRYREVFEAVYLSLGRYECLVADLRPSSGVLSDRLFWYKARSREALRKFRFQFTALDIL